MMSNQKIKQFETLLREHPDLGPKGLLKILIDHDISIYAPPNPNITFTVPSNTSINTIKKNNGCSDFLGTPFIPSSGEIIGASVSEFDLYKIMDTGQSEITDVDHILLYDTEGIKTKTPESLTSPAALKNSEYPVKLNQQTKPKEKHLLRYHHKISKSIKSYPITIWAFEIPSKFPLAFQFRLARSLANKKEKPSTKSNEQFLEKEQLLVESSKIFIYSEDLKSVNEIIKNKHPLPHELISASKCDWMPRLLFEINRISYLNQELISENPKNLHQILMHQIMPILNYDSQNNFCENIADILTPKIAGNWKIAVRESSQIFDDLEHPSAKLKFINWYAKTQASYIKESRYKSIYENLCEEYGLTQRAAITIAKLLNPEK